MTHSPTGPAVAGSGTPRSPEVCGVVLAAGEGQRLRPLTATVPKALCPVGNLPLLDHALRRLAGLGLLGPEDVAVNAAYLADQVVAYATGRAHLSVEPDGPLGTSGGVARLRKWIDGRGVLVGNADAYLADPFRDPGRDIEALCDGWSGDTVRLLTKPCRPGEAGGFSGNRFAGFSLLPWRYVATLPDEHSDLVRTAWRPAEAEGALELIGYEGHYLDTGTPSLYLEANLHAAGAGLVDPSAEVTGTATGSVVGAGAHVAGTATGSVVGAGAHVAGRITRCVVWPGATVEPGEDLAEVIRAPGGLTVPAAGLGG
ncbi:nucleotidyl transferase [Actinoplanes sp. SE50]|uniref:NTP transferase domain-containing protein n=1 Tax=unclassified Actinoplanes TaxID=2626549 RepID=UPI00023EC74A|nr:MULTISPECIES: NTP transferase domain-containing protein [unclassified Actinoplanes]AEV82553.1 nucleotidyl transferase [Actinoplanes sp. SE50/110]ATO80949.1 nucleotidyl transferase [Actinoplanes sp. SE50]SLL98356.1 nucleotidyltransferase [Actinoplanes sp. SE50/110]